MIDMDVNSALLSISGLLNDGSGGGSSILVNKDINQNGVYLPIDDGADGYKKVSVNVPSPTFITKIIPANGTYAASSDNADGYSEVTVAVPSGTIIQAPYKVASGKYTPASNTREVYLPITGSGMTTVAAVFMECEDTVDYATTYLSLAPVLLYLMYAYPHSIFGVGGNAGVDLTWLIEDGSLSYTGSLGGASVSPVVSGDNVHIKWTQTPIAKPGVTYNYIVVGV